MDQSMLSEAFQIERIRVRGLVQGVGFRPTVYRIATALGLRGEVYNDGAGVMILVAGKDYDIDTFVITLERECPPLARIDKIERCPINDGLDFDEFRIRDSEHNKVRTAIVADAATCPACVSDINDPGNRRHGYVFTNCTHCGPRLSIVHNIPYDRARTSMASFDMCPACRAEYDDPANRRFHAQPNACPDCGPKIWLCDSKGEIVACDDVIAEAASLIEHGRILAIKGIGGFQLACDASNGESVRELRRRKQRPHKSLALMAAHVHQVREYCRVSSDEAGLLESHQAPIVVLSTQGARHSLPEVIAPGNNTLGFMLPYSPLHHRLMQRLADPIVLTSGNRSEEPQCIDNDQALERLGDIVDYFLMHDRDIVNRIDDSVLRVIDDQPRFYRRARGYAPTPLPLPPGLECPRPILALGGELKNTFCLARQEQAILSQHMGNLENALTLDDTLKNLDLYQRLFEVAPAAIIIDRHPEYLSSKHGEGLAASLDLPLIRVQHHHAHVAACMADNGWTPADGKLIGVALDGLGFGADGAIWGGEFMLADYHDFERLARLKPAPMPGGTRAILEPWRNTLAHLYTHCDWADLNHRYSATGLLKFINRQPLQVLTRMMRQQLNSPPSSSAGRLFDAVAAALGLARERISFEGQAAMALESLVDEADMRRLTAYPFQLEHGELLDINPAPMWMALLQDLAADKPASEIAARFHLCLVQMLRQAVLQLAELSGLRSVALSGGVFQNATLLSHAAQTLRDEGLDVLIHRHTPSNDGGLALGQVAIASAQLHGGQP